MGEAATKEVIEIIQVVFTNLAQGFVHICYTQHGRNQFLLFAFAAALLAFSLVFSKELVSLLLTTLQIMARTPKIVREYGNLNFMSRRRSLLLAASSKPVLPPGIERRLEHVCKANIKAYRSGAPMRHLLICGKSGTGKSLVATTMARCMINLPYAVMSGADIAPLGRLGPLELRRLLTWANNRRKGAVIIIDEAESALGSRIRERTKSGINAGLVTGDDITGEADGIGYARDSLNVLLSLTGCTYTKFMLIITTSHPEKLDEAILDRMDDTIEIPLPGEPERLQMLRVEFSKRFCKSNAVHLSSSSITAGQIAYEESFHPEKELELLGSNKMTYNFSGREIKKVIHAVSSKIYSGELSILSKEAWDEITRDVCKSITAKKSK
jgi:ATPase family AAA domain-containing protein 3A/B